MEDAGQFGIIESSFSLILRRSSPCICLFLILCHSFPICLLHTHYFETRLTNDIVLVCDGNDSCSDLIVWMLVCPSRSVCVVFLVGVAAGIGHEVVVVMSKAMFVRIMKLYLLSYFIGSLLRLN